MNSIQKAIQVQCGRFEKIKHKIQERPVVPLNQAEACLAQSKADLEQAITSLSYEKALYAMEQCLVIQTHVNAARNRFLEEQSRKPN